MNYKCPKCQQNSANKENDCLRHGVTYVDIITFFHCNDCDYRWEVVDRYTYEETFVGEDLATI